MHEWEGEGGWEDHGYGHNPSVQVYLSMCFKNLATKVKATFLNSGVSVMEV